MAAASPPFTFIRRVLATHPLFAHAAVGACVSASFALAFVKSGEGAAPAVAAELSAAAFLGALQGSVLRFYYPVVERGADLLLALPVLRRLQAFRPLCCAALDHVPAVLSTFGVSYSARSSLATGAVALLDNASLARRGSARARKGARATEDELEELELIDAALASAPTAANAGTAAASLANFGLVPRHPRGVLGIAQLQLFEGASAALRNE